VPITTLVGSGVVTGRLELRTSLAFADVALPTPGASSMAGGVHHG
jgi:hypothetical protein